MPSLKGEVSPSPAPVTEGMPPLQGEVSPALAPVTEGFCALRDRPCLRLSLRTVGPSIARPSLVRRPAPMSDQRATKGRPYGANGQYTRRGDSRIARRPAPVYDQRAGNTRPYEADVLRPLFQSVALCATPQLFIIHFSLFIHTTRDSCDSCDGFFPVTGRHRLSQA